MGEISPFGRNLTCPGRRKNGRAKFRQIENLGEIPVADWAKMAKFENFWAKFGSFLANLAIFLTKKYSKKIFGAENMGEIWAIFCLKVGEMGEIWRFLILGEI